MTEARPNEGPVAAAARGARGLVARRRAPAPPPTPGSVDPSRWRALLGPDAAARERTAEDLRRADGADDYRAALIAALGDVEAYGLAERRAAGEALDLLGDPRVTTRDPAMVAVPAGPFLMGTLEADAAGIIEEYAHANVQPRFLAKEMPRHEVQVDAFEIGRYPVTNGEYVEFVRATGRPPPPSWPEGSVPPGRGTHPVVRIGHEDATGYTQWLSAETGRRYRLPTEAEWEKAARGTDGRLYPWGNFFDPDRCNTLEGNTFALLYRRARPLYGVVMRVGAFVVDRGLIGESFDRLVATTPVGIFPHGASPYGALDMAGNAEEWVADRFALYPGHPADDGYDWSAEGHVCRGGAWNRPGDVARVARRHGDYVRTGSIGLRLAR